MLKNTNSLIIGYGEIGKALEAVLKQYYQVQVYDKSFGKANFIKGENHYLHICFPYTKDFVKEVKKYQKLLHPEFTIIHSTVSIGTSRKLRAIHSPVIGKHPFLKEALLSHIKFIGGKDSSLVADYFRKAGFRIQLCDKQKTTELAKLLQTEYYKRCIEFTLEAKKLCDKYDVPFSEAYTLMNQAENEANIRLGFPEQVRPVLQPIMTPIGGHCLIPNSKLLCELTQKNT